MASNMAGHRSTASMNMLRERENVIPYLLPDEVWVVSGLHLERAVLGPQVDGMADTCDAPLVDHLCGFGACNVEFEVGVFLPISEQQRKLE